MTLGPYYLKGTWAGLVLTKTGEHRLIVEKYEQDLSDIYVKGWSFKLDGQRESEWISNSIQVSPLKGELHCFLTVYVPYKTTPLETLGRLQFDRSSDTVGPIKMTGHTINADATDKLIYVNLYKLSDKLLDLDVAKKQTFKQFAVQIGNL